MAGEEDPLFLQVKEARPSVLEAYADQSERDHERFVQAVRTGEVEVFVEDE